MKSVAVFLILITLSGCGHPSQRFVPVGEGGMALDTKTGQQCFSLPKKELTDPGNFPYCYDLYKDSN